MGLIPSDLRKEGSGLDLAYATSPAGIWSSPTGAVEDGAQGVAQLRWRRLEIGFVLVSLLLYSNALIGPIFAPDQTTTDDLAWLRDLWLPVYGGTLLFCLARGRLFRPLNPAWWVLGAPVLWCALSRGWSIDADVTTRRAFALAATTLFGVYLATSFGRGAFVRIAAGALVALALGSVLVAVLDPKLGVEQGVNGGDWRGLWYQKNALGGMMAFGVFTCLAASNLPVADGRRRWPWLAGAGLCLSLVLMSRSKTALLCAVVPAALYALAWAIRRSAVLAVAGVFVVGTVGGAIASVLWLAPDLFYASLGKDPTLTGRTDIWAALFRQVALRPRLGYGYGAFWLKDSAPAAFVRAETGWLVPSAHNGWLDVLVQVGWIGVALVGGAVAIAVIAALVRGWSADDGGWSLFFVSAFVIRSLSESVLVSQNSFDWALFAAAATTLLMRGTSADANRCGLHMRGAGLGQG